MLNSNYKNTNSNDSYSSIVSELATNMISEWKNADRTFINQNSFCRETRNRCKNFYDRIFFHNCDYCKLPPILCNNYGQGGLMGIISISEGLEEKECNCRIHYKIKRIPPILKVAMLMGLHDLRKNGKLSKISREHIKKVIDIHDAFIQIMKNSILSNEPINIAS